MFFTAVNLMDDNQDLEEVEYDLEKPRIAVHKNTWRAHPKTVYWCNLKLAQRKGLQFFQTRPHAITLFNTLPATCIENVVYMKTGEELSCKVLKSRRLPRLYLRQIRNMDVRIRLVPKRENPPTIKANNAWTGKLVAHLSRTYSILEKVSDEGTVKPVAVTLSTEFQVYLTRLSRKKIRIARKPSKD